MLFLRGILHLGLHVLFRIWEPYVARKCLFCLVKVPELAAYITAFFVHVRVRRDDGFGTPHRASLWFSWDHVIPKNCYGFFV